MLLVDADNQCNTSVFFGADARNGSVSAALRQCGTWDDAETRLLALIQPTKLPGIDILAADDSLMDLDLSKEAESRYAKKRYEYIMIDCRSPLTQHSLRHRFNCKI